MTRFIDVPRPLIRASRGVVACGHPLAVAAALQLFNQDGNAVDAAIAAAAALSVVLPESCGLGGDALFMVREPDGTIVAWNGSGAAPIGLTGAVPEDGAATAAVPGAVRSWEAAHTKLGSLPWAGVFAPAIDLAESGMPYSESLSNAVERHRLRLEHGASAWQLLAPGLRPGDRVAQPALGGVLRRIAEEGSSAFYQGAVAQAIEDTVSRAGGFMSTKDLARHEVAELSPITGPYRGVRLSAQPPVSQAALALLALSELEHTGCENVEAQTHVLIEAIGVSFDHRERFGSMERVRDLLRSRLGVDTDRAQRRRGPRLPEHTTSVSTADSEGRVVSMLISVFDEFGSATLVEEAGILLNDRMVGFSRDSSSPNFAAPGRRPVHSLSPFLVDDGERIFALATPGADGQVQIIAQLIASIVDRGASLVEALHLPRWRSADGRLYLEGGFSDELAADLDRRGHVLLRAPAAAGMFGAAVIAGVDLASGTLFAASDPRREAWAGGC